jgi:hypothetical protein
MVFWVLNRERCITYQRLIFLFLELVCGNGRPYSCRHRVVLKERAGEVGWSRLGFGEELARQDSAQLCC